MAVKKDNVNSSELLGSGFNFEGFEDSGVETQAPSMANIPLLKLMQNMSPEAASREFPDVYPGNIIDSNSKEVVGEVTPEGNSVRVRILRTWTSRAKFPPRDSGSSGIECSCPTHNLETDYGIPYGECKCCPYNSFGNVDSCRVQYNIICADADDPEKLYRIILAKTSFQASKKLTRELKAYSAKYGKKGQTIPYFLFTVVVSARQVKDNKRGSSYYVYELNVQDPTTSKNLDKAGFDAFTDAYNDVKDLRQATLDYHQEQVEAMKAKGENKLPEAEQQGNDTIMSVFGNTVFDEDVTGSENVPF